MLQPASELWRLAAPLANWGKVNRNLAQTVAGGSKYNLLLLLVLLLIESGRVEVMSQRVPGLCPMPLGRFGIVNYLNPRGRFAGRLARFARSRFIASPGREAPSTRCEAAPRYRALFPQESALICLQIAS